MNHNWSYHLSRQSSFDLLTIHLQSFIAKLVAIYIIVFVFEETIYGRLELGATSYLAAKTATEVFLYLFLLLVIVHQLVQGRLQRYQPTSFDYCIVLFFCTAFISTLVNDGSLVQGVINVRTMLRYVTIYYIIVLSRWVPTEQQVTQFIKLLAGIALIQSLLITLQHFAGDTFRDTYFSPPKVEVIVSGITNILGAMESKLGAGYGTFGKTPLAAFYLLLVSVVTVAMALSSRSQKAKIWWFAYAIILIGIYFSYKRAPLLFALIAPVLVAWFIGRKQLVLHYAAIAVIITPLALIFLSDIKSDGYVDEKKTELSPTESIAQLFTEEYWTVSSNKARGWMLFEVGQRTLVPFKPLGFGADEEHAKAKLAVIGGEFSKLTGWEAFDDVYIVAGLAYYGPVGMSLLLLAFYSLYRHGKILTVRSPVGIFQIVGTILTTSIVLMLLSVFVVRLLEFRPFAFPFWVIAGISVAALRKYTVQQH